MNNDATFNNNVNGTVSGLLTNTAGTTTNDGQLNGGATITGGTVTNNNLISGTVAISGTGTVNNNLTITGRGEQRRDLQQQRERYGVRPADQHRQRHRDQRRSAQWRRQPSPAVRLDQTGGSITAA